MIPPTKPTLQLPLLPNGSNIGQDRTSSITHTENTNNITPNNEGNVNTSSTASTACTAVSPTSSPSPSSSLALSPNTYMPVVPSMRNLLNCLNYQGFALIGGTSTTFAHHKIVEQLEALQKETTIEIVSYQYTELHDIEAFYNMILVRAT